jgi:sialidase-1
MPLTRRSALLHFASAVHPRPTTLFSQGQAGIHTYRIPALIETPNHHLLALADARHYSEDDLPGKISIVLRRSIDFGRTWLPMETLASTPSGGVSDPAVLLAPNGRLWCFYAYGPPGIGFRTARPGPLTGPEVLQLHAISSDDNGRSWSPPRDLTPQLRDPSWHAFFVTSGTHFPTSTGRLILPLVIRDARQQVYARNAYSDNLGETWRLGQPVAPNTDESKVAELPNGHLIQNLRTPARQRLLVRSTDGGLTFTSLTPQPALLDASCNAGFARYRHGGRDLLLFTNAAAPDRRNLAIRASADSGHTWTAPLTLHSGPAAYSTVLPLSDGSVAVLYEAGRRSYTESIRFLRLSPASLRPLL